MHAEARHAVERIADAYGLRDRTDLAVCDLGGRNINGSVRDLFAAEDWTAVDSADGPGVDIVADARTWKPARGYGLVLCTEVLEHVPGWQSILTTAETALAPGGVLIVTCASDRRQPHGTGGGQWPEPGEHYSNVPPAELLAELANNFPGSWGMEYGYPPGDLYAWAQKEHR